MPSGDKDAIAASITVFGGSYQRDLTKEVTRALCAKPEGARPIKFHRDDSPVELSLTAPLARRLSTRSLWIIATSSKSSFPLGSSYFPLCLLVRP
jgi:hypothetical protein